MQIQARIDAEALICEVMRYLAAVDAFRAERCEPMWRPEPVPSADGRSAQSEPEHT